MEFPILSIRQLQAVSRFKTIENNHKDYKLFIIFIYFFRSFQIKNYSFGHKGN